MLLLSLFRIASHWSGGGYQLQATPDVPHGKEVPCVSQQCLFQAFSLAGYIVNQRMACILTGNVNMLVLLAENFE